MTECYVPKIMINPILPNLKDKDNLFIFACFVLHFKKQCMPNASACSKESLTERSADSI